ncbi:hypothetical protein ACHAQJ_009103 [Trichoderma viride]
MASLILRPAEPADAAALADIHYRALDRYHEFYGAFFVLSPREILTRSIPVALEKADNVFLVAVDGESGDDVGFVKYAVEAEKVASAAAAAAAAATAVKATEESVTVSVEPPSFTAIKAHMKELWAEFGERRDEMDECYEKAADGKKHIYVHTLMIHPDHQRRGIGGKLLAAVLKRSDDEGIPTFLMSTAESIGLYSRMGFASLGRWPIDNGYWAGRIVELEKGLEISGHEGLEERFRGVGEVEDVMVRWPKD